MGALGGICFTPVGIAIVDQTRDLILSVWAPFHFDRSSPPLAFFVRPFSSFTKHQMYLTDEMSDLSVLVLPRRPYPFLAYLTPASHPPSLPYSHLWSISTSWTFFHFTS